MINAITSLKLAYYRRIAAKLNDLKTAPKTYWAILKLFAHVKKIPQVPPLFMKNHLVTSFVMKTNLFNDHFSSQQ